MTHTASGLPAPTHAVWLRLTYPPELWQRYLRHRRPPLTIVPSSTLLFAVPMLLLVLFLEPGLLWETRLGPFIVLCSLLFSTLLYLAFYLPYRRLTTAKQPHAAIGPTGYALSPDRWTQLMPEYYRYRAELRHNDKAELDFIVLRKEPRVNADTGDRASPVELPVQPSDLSVAAAFIERFNAYHARELLRP